MGYKSKNANSYLNDAHFLNEHRSKEAQKNRQRSVYDLHLAKSVTAPATTGEATLVPDRDRHPSFIPDPRTPEP